MILWLVLFLLVLGLSFVLAARSMRDFEELPATSQDYSLFLIRKPKNLTAELLISIAKSLKSGQVLSLERLFKGNREAVVVFGPGELLVNFNSLDLLELEDYTNINTQPFSAALVGIKSGGEGISATLPQLEQPEQFWWQLTFAGQFDVQILAVLLSSDANKRANLDDIIQNLAPGKLFTLPKIITQAQILESYKKRIFFGNKKFSLNAEEVIQLFHLPLLFLPQHRFEYPVK